MKVTVRPMLPEDEAFVQIQGIERHVSEKGLQRYNEQLEKFHIAFGQHAKKIAEYNNQRRRLLKLDLTLTNNGNCPAQDVEVFLTLPLKFHLGRDDWLKNHPEPPEVPEVPEIRSASLAIRNLYGGSIDSMISRRGGQVLPTVDHGAPAIQKAQQGYTVRYFAGKLKHGQTLPLRPLYLLFFDDDSICSFAISYEIHADNLSRHLTGELNVAVTDTAAEEKNWVSTLRIPKPKRR